jgi:phosphonate transport system ATP-binding protein
VLTLDDVTVRYGRVTALDRVSLSVAAGERVALVGPSGAGKSTVLRLCTGAVHPTDGAVHVLGEPLDALTGRRLTRLRRRVGTVHQQLHLVPRLRVVHNVNAGRLGHWPWWRALASLVVPRDVDRVRAALEATGVEAMLEERTDRLSGGEQQRVALARVLVQEPDLVLADEPVSSLDPVRADEVLRLLCDTVATGHRALVVSLHDFELAVRRCDRVVGLRGGAVLFDLPADRVDDRLRRRLYELEPT